MSTDETTRPGAPTRALPPRRRPRHRRRALLALVVLVLLAAVLALAWLARPVLHAKHEADLAQADLKAAKSALSAGQPAKADVQIRQARAHVDAAEADLHGVGADVWAGVPMAGGAVHDARHLVDALSETTAVAQLGVRVYPLVQGRNAHLVDGQRVDITTLRRVVSLTSQIGSHLDRAVADLDAVHGSTPFVGGSVTRAKATALDYLAPVQDSYDKTGPLVQSLPSIVGADGPRTYLLAMLNPAELRFSGGGALSFTTITFDHGAATFGQTVNVDDLLQRGAVRRWKPVKGNPFHRPRPTRLTNATFSPWWSVSGEELLHGYQKVFPGRHLSGVIGIDLQGLAQLFKVTGPVELPHFGQISADNLVPVLAGSYSAFSSIQVRHQLNAELVQAFRQKFFESGSMTDKVKALVSSADGRHFFATFTDPGIQRHIVQVGLSGDLSPTPYDYVGVFTQNLNGSKTDYWQRRSVASRVVLHADGSAGVHLHVTVTNGAPAFASATTADPKTGYTTRYLGASVGVFLPNHSLLGGVTANGAPLQVRLRKPSVAGVHDREYFTAPLMLNHGQSWSLDATYTVPHAAQRVGSTWVYRLDVDPQPMVNPETVQVSVTWPPGWTPTGALPPGWTATAGGARYQGVASTRQSFEIPLAQH